MRMIMKSNLLLFLLVLLGGVFANAEVVIYSIGDSTMADKPDRGDHPERGWCQYLKTLVVEGVVFENHGKGGRSSKSFIDEGRWDLVLEKLAPGDWVLIQFGHNDQKVYDPARYTSAYTGFRANLERFVKEARDKGAKPLLMNSIARRKFNEDGTLLDTHEAYSLVARLTALELGVPFVDMTVLTEELVRDLGVEESKSLFVWAEAGEFESLPGGKQDNTHLNSVGAEKVSGLFLESIRKQELELSLLFLAL